MKFKFNDLKGRLLVLATWGMPLKLINRYNYEIKFGIYVPGRVVLCYGIWPG